MTQFLAIGLFLSLPLLAVETPVTEAQTKAVGVANIASSVSPSTASIEQESEEADPATQADSDKAVMSPAPAIAPAMDLSEEVEAEPQVAPATKPATPATVETNRSMEDLETPISVPDEETPADPLVILGSEVAPGIATRLAWRPDVSIDGLQQSSPVLVINGAKQGPTLCMTAAIHGDELNGIEIIRRVMYDINPNKLSGRIIGVPIVNLQGFQRSTRYLPDRRDLNRFFPGDPYGSMASRIAYSLFNEIIVHCDALIDLHTGSFRRINLPQVRADMRNPAIVDFVKGFDDMVVVHGEGSPGMLRGAAVLSGIVAVTVEAGESLRFQADQVKKAVTSINSLLERQGMYSRFFSWSDPKPAFYKSLWLRSPVGGILLSEIKLGDSVTPGQVLGTVTDPITNKSTDIVSEVRGRVIGMAVDQVVMPGFAAYHVGIKSPENRPENIVEAEATPPDAEFEQDRSDAPAEPVRPLVDDQIIDG